MKTLVSFGLISVALVALSSSLEAAPRYSDPNYIPVDSAYNSNNRDMMVAPVQLALQARGYYCGLRSGEFVFETKRAIRRYRRDRGMPELGKIDAWLVQDLGLSRY